MLMNHEYHLALLRERENGIGYVSLYRCFAGKFERLARVPCEFNKPVASCHSIRTGLQLLYGYRTGAMAARL